MLMTPLSPKNFISATPNFLGPQRLLDLRSPIVGFGVIKSSKKGEPLEVQKSTQ
jgi:hypothetical protein